MLPALSKPARSWPERGRLSRMCGSVQAELAAQPPTTAAGEPERKDGGGAFDAETLEKGDTRLARSGDTGVHEGDGRRGGPGEPATRSAPPRNGWSSEARARCPPTPATSPTGTTARSRSSQVHRHPPAGRVPFPSPVVQRPRKPSRFPDTGRPGKPIVVLRVCDRA